MNDDLSNCRKASNQNEFNGLLIRVIVGKPATTGDPANVFFALARGVRRALEHAHDNQITHLHDRPKNVIYVDVGIGKFEVDVNAVLSQGGSVDAEPLSSQLGSTDAESESSLYN